MTSGRSSSSLRREDLRLGAVGRGALRVDRHARDEREDRSSGATPRMAAFSSPHVHEGLQDEEVGAGPARAAACRANSSSASAAPMAPMRLHLDAQGADGTGHERRSPSRPGLLDGLARELHRAAVDLRELLREPGGAQLRDARAPAVGRDHVRPGIQVLAVDADDQAGVREAHLLEGTVQEHAPLVEHRSHGAVEEDGLVPAEPGAEIRLQPGLALSATFSLPSPPWPRGPARFPSTAGSSGRSRG